MYCYPGILGIKVLRWWLWINTGTQYSGFVDVLHMHNFQSYSYPCRYDTWSFGAGYGTFAYLGCPWPTPFFLFFGFRYTDAATKNAEGLVSFIMCFMSSGHGGGGGGGGGGGDPTANKFKNHRRSCVDCLRVSTRRGAFEPSRLDDKQPSGPAETTTAPPPPPPRPYVHPCVHLTSLT